VRSETPFPPAFPPGFLVTLALGNVVAAPLTDAAQRHLADAGRATRAKLTDAEVALTRARLDSMAARVGLRVARVELAHADGFAVEE